MDISRGIFTEKDKQTQQPWFPITPAKPMPPRPQPISGPTTSFQDLLCKQSSFTSVVVDVEDDDPSTDFYLDNVEPVLPDKDGGGDLRLDHAADWKKPPYSELFALAEAASGAGDASTNAESSAAFEPGSSSYQIGSNNLQQQETASAPLVDQNSLASSSMLNFNLPSHISHSGFQVPSSRPVYDLNSLPSTSNMVYNVPVAYQFEPITPNHGKRANIRQGSEAANASLYEQQYQENGQQKVVCCAETDVPELASMSASGAMEFSAATLSSPMKDNHIVGKGEANDIDLNTPPQSQKPKRRKHRPKVITEGKPRKAAKPRNPKQGNDAEKPRARRKYVRKTAPHAEDSTAVNCDKDAIDSTPRSAARSSKRALNFDLEDQETDRRTKTQHSVGQQREFPRWGHRSRTQGWEVVIEKPTAQTAFDLNHYSTQKLDDSITSAEKPSSETPQPLEKEQKKEYLKIQPRMISTGEECQSTIVPTQVLVEGTACIALPANTSSTSISPECLNIAENGSSVTPKQLLTERAACVSLPAKTAPCGVQTTSTSHQDQNCSSSQTDVRESNKELLGGQFDSLQVYPEVFHRIHKKKRTRGISYGPGYIRGTNMQSQTNDARPALQSNDTNITADTIDAVGNSGRSLYAHSMPAVCNSQVRNSYAQLSCIEMLNGSGKLMIDNVAYGQSGRTTKMRSKVSTRPRDVASLAAVLNWNQLQQTTKRIPPRRSTGKQLGINCGPPACVQALAVDSHAYMIKKKRTRKGLRQATSASYLYTNRSWLQNPLVSSYQRPRSLPRSRGSSRAARNYSVTMDELAYRFMCLSINTCSDSIRMHEQNAMVLYNKNGTMIPYEGGPKRRRPRPKVDLDPESDRVWKLLMGKECQQIIQGTPQDNEKWWDEERRVFRLKVDSFIARMHLVQGDRRFSPWKGSVVDSCIGVFLTQNVSDHLSSSAFMSLCAKYPREETDVYVEEPEICTPDLDITLDSSEMRLFEQISERGYNMAREGVEHIQETGVAEWSKRLENHMTGTRDSWLVDAESKGQMEEVVSSQNSVASSENSASSGNCREAENSTPKCTGLSEAKGKRVAEDVISSQSSDMSNLQTSERIGSCSGSNSEAEDMVSRCKSNILDCSRTSTDLLHMSGSAIIQEYYARGCGSISPENKPESVITQSKCTGSGRSNMENLDTSKGSIHSVTLSNFSLPTPGVASTCLSNNPSQMSQEARVHECECLEVSNEKGKLPLLSTASGIADVVDADCFSKHKCCAEEAASESTVRTEVPSSAQVADSSTLQSKYLVQPLCTSRDEAWLQKHPQSCCNSSQMDMLSNLEPQSSTVEMNNHDEGLGQKKGGMQQADPSSLRNSKEILSVEETMHMRAEEKATDFDKRPNSSTKEFNEATVNKLKAKEKPVKEKKTIDWDSLRKEAYREHPKKERTRDTVDTLNYDQLRAAPVSEIADTIKARGMNNMLSERIKDFLERLVRDHECVDLEWLKDVPPDQAKEFLLSIRGLGLKSVECVRLLTLHQHAFPVDTNVGRIAVRLGWVPLQPLPEQLQLHLLELYPVQETIQKYLWPRLCKLDQTTLYELHYQMITFGKVFCTKSKPNCNACPLRADCRHFASAFASSRLKLQGPEEKGMVPSTIPIGTDSGPAVESRPMQIALPLTNSVAETGSLSAQPNSELVSGSTLQEPEDVSDTRSMLLDTNLLSESGSRTNACDPIIEYPATPRSRTIECEPIIEVPASPEAKSIDILERDMEDAFYYEDPEESEIPTIDLSMEQFTRTLQSCMQENNWGTEGYDISNALVALTPQAASIPTTKLKNVSRLRTEHQVYALPDDHPLLAGLDKREENDPGTYLLAISTEGNSVETVQGTLLIPCRTAMRGNFPLNGTYFQVNEVFADHASSITPIDVPRKLLWNLPRRIVYFGTSVPSIFKGLSMEEIQKCFWRGYICVRGFERKTRAPRPLKARLHFTASRLKEEVKNAE